MGDSVKKATRRGLEGAASGTGLLKFDEIKKIHKKSTQITEKPFRKGTSAARRDAAAQAERQMQMEKVRADEAESEIAQKRQLAGSKVGRQSLIKSSPSGLATTLGG